MVPLAPVYSNKSFFVLGVGSATTRKSDGEYHNLRADEL